MSEPAAGAPGGGDADRIPLHNTNPGLTRRRLISGLVGVLIFGAAAGGIAGLIGDTTAGLIAAAMVGLPLLYLVLVGARRQLWLQDGALVVRTWGTRRVHLVSAQRIDLVITDVRGVRTVAMLITPKAGAQSVKVDLALYTATGGRELGLLPLRQLANALINNIDANGMVFSELLVAQLRSEARGDGMEARPLHRLAVAAPKGKLAQRYTMEAVSKFVASLD